VVHTKIDFLDSIYGLFALYFSVPNSLLPMLKEAESRNRGIDLARSLAILLVVLTHVCHLSVGRWGVQLFFIISGYLLSDFKIDPSRFLRKRFARLFPLTLLLCTLFYLDVFAGWNQLLLHFTLLQNAFPAPSGVPGLWSISNEWLFSIAVIFLIKITKRWFFTLIISITLLQFVTGYLVWEMDITKYLADEDKYALLIWINTTNPIINLAFFLAGLGIRRKFLKFKSNWMVGSFLVILTVLCHYLIGSVMPLWLFTLTYLFNLMKEIKLESKLLLRLVSNIGTTTFGIYFFHFLVLNFFEKLYFFQPNESDYREVILFAVVWVVSWVLGNLSWFLIEKPAILLERKFISSSL
jgi:peptidoglycan/LPS O-acetylase OafA/YrhL